MGRNVYILTVLECRFYINKYLPTCVYCVIIVHYDGYINTTPHILETKHNTYGITLVLCELCYIAKLNFINNVMSIYNTA